MKFTKLDSNVFLLFSLLLLISLSCSSYTIKRPPSGITNKFYNKNTTELKEFASYDFSKLKKNYGLVIFSYEVSGKSGSNIGGTKAKTKTGIRIWEKKFSDDDWEIKQENKTIQLWESNTLAPNFVGGATLSTLTSMVDVEVTFYKNRIIYGGRLIASTLDNDFQVLSRFDEDCSQFIEKYQRQIDGVRIDTVFVNYLLNY